MLALCEMIGWIAETTWKRLHQPAKQQALRDDAEKGTQLAPPRYSVAQYAPAGTSPRRPICSRASYEPITLARPTFSPRRPQSLSASHQTSAFGTEDSP